MANQARIVLSGYGELDVFDASIPLNFAVSEIQNINSRQGVWSKTITLPGTPNNKNIFGHLYDVNILDQAYDYNKKVFCQVIQQGIPILDGYLQLKNVKKTSPSLGVPDEFVEFEVLIKDATADFFKTGIGQKMLTDIDLSQWDHIYSASSISASSAHTYADVYKYHMTNRQSGEYKLTDFTPNIFAKKYFDEIIREAGYTYVWTGASYNDFCRMVIPYNGDKPSGQVDEIKFRAGWSATTKQLISLNSAPDQRYLQFKWNDDSNSPNFDTNGVFDITTGEYTQSIFANNQINVKYEWKLYASAVTSQQLQFPNVFQIQIENSAFINSNQYLLPTPQVYSTNLTNSFIFPGGGQFALISSGISEFSYTVNAGPGTIFEERVFTNTNLIQNISGPFVLSGTSTITPPSDWPSFFLEIGRVGDPDNNFIFSGPTDGLYEGMTVKLNDFIPKNVKQSDFFSSIVSLFNLYITTSKTKDRELIIMSRDEFYDSGGELDWTNKIDLNSNIELEFIPEVTNKRVLLSYNPDNDSYNKTYTEQTGDVYGQFEYIFPSEFVDGTKTVGPQFSPTPTVLNKLGFAVPALTVQAPKTNIRILYDCGWLPGEWRLLNSTAMTIVSFLQPPVFTSSYTYYDAYPVATCLDNPYTPTTDLNFGLNSFEFYNTYDYLTNNNMYNKYYKRFLTQIEKGKMLKAKFNLNAFDIANLDLRDKVWVFDAWYHINAIKDYNPNAEGALTEVELITVEDGLDFSEFQTTSTNVGGKFSYLDNLGSINLGEIDNTIGVGVSDSDVLGEGNVVQDSSVRMRISGNFNYGGANNSQIIGDYNYVGGNQININGNSNTIK